MAGRHEGLWREDPGDIRARAALGLLAAADGAWDVSALPVRAAAIVMVVPVPACPLRLTWRPARPVAKDQRPLTMGRCGRPAA